MAKNPYAQSGKLNSAVKGKLNDLASGKGAAGVYSKIGKVAGAVKGNSGKLGIGLAGLAAGTMLAKKTMGTRKKSLSGKLTSAIKRQAKKL